MLSLLTTTYSLQHCVQAPVESGEVGLRQQWSHTVEGILGERGPHDITEAILWQRQETQAEPCGATDSRNTAECCVLLCVEKNAVAIKDWNVT